MAILHIDGLAYCELKFEKQEKAATSNFIDKFYIHEGFGKAVPQLVMYLNDSSFSLMRELGLYDGSKISIKHGRTTNSLVERKFTVFGMKNVSAANGPRLQVLAVLDAPMFVNHVDRKAYKGGSSAIMSEFASESGLEYDGPGGTDDSQTWLRINTTLSDFSEYVAMKGYTDKKSCMARVVTSTGKLRYKNLTQVMSGSPGKDVTFCLNVDSEVNLSVRELQDFSTAGAGNTYVAYGHTKGKHTLDSNNQQVVNMIEPAKNGHMLPLNPEIDGMVEARRDYHGFDCGTKPKPASNMHEHFVSSEHQNTINLSLFSQRLRLLIDNQVEVEPFDIVGLKHNEMVGDNYKRVTRTEGKYLHGGKTMAFVNGHHYYEVHDLYRNFINNPTEGADAVDSGDAGASNAASANTAGMNTDALNSAGANGQLADLNGTRDDFNARALNEGTDLPQSTPNNTSALASVQTFVEKAEVRKPGARSTPLTPTSNPDAQEQATAEQQQQADQEFVASVDAMKANDMLASSVSEAPVQNSNAFAIQELSNSASETLVTNGAVEVGMADVTELSDSPAEALGATNSIVVPNEGAADTNGKNTIGEMDGDSLRTTGDDQNGNELDKETQTDLLGPSLSGALTASKNSETAPYNLADMPIADVAASNGDPELDGLTGTVADNWPDAASLASVAHIPFVGDGSQGMLSAVSSFFQAKTEDTASDSSNFNAESPDFNALDMYETLENLDKFVGKENPTEYLINNGADEYKKLFGTLSPEEAQATVGALRSDITTLQNDYQASPKLAYTPGRVQRFEVDQPGVTPVVRVTDRTHKVGDDHTQVITKGQRISWEEFKA